jgi:hypothetical protein
VHVAHDRFRGSIRAGALTVAQERAEVDGSGAHADPLARSRRRPLLDRAIAVELDTVAVGIVDVQGLAHPVVTRADLVARLEETGEGVGQRRTSRVADGDVEQPGGAGIGGPGHAL